MVQNNIEKTSDTPMQRITNSELDKLIGVKFPVLDHGFVMLVDYMGGDSSIVQAARVSYGSGTKTFREDEGLIRYLMRHDHTTPFEMVEFKFAMRMPFFVARQIVRHRTVSINEYSARYSVVPDFYYIPEKDDITAQSATNRQGRDSEKKLPNEVVEWFRNSVTEHSKDSYSLYEKALESGIPRELARMVLPLNYYTEWYWKINLHNMFHFLQLRIDPHAQEETRRYAMAMAEIVKIAVPVAYKAFEDFSLHAVRFSEKESMAVKDMLNGASFEDSANRNGLRLYKEDGTAFKTGEGPEFIQKMEWLTKRNMLRV